MVAGFSDFGGEAFLVGISDFVAEAFFAGISDFAGGAFFVSSLCFESPGSTLDFKLCKSSCRLRLFELFFLFFVFDGLSSPLHILHGHDWGGMHVT